MRDGAPVDPNLSLADMLPPDKSDSSGILQAGYALVEALARRAPTSGPLEVTVILGSAAWAALEAETRRPYRGHATYKYTPHPGGAGAVRWVRDGTDAVAVETERCARIARDWQRNDPAHPIGPDDHAVRGEHAAATAIEAAILCRPTGGQARDISAEVEAAGEAVFEDRS